MRLLLLLLHLESHACDKERRTVGAVDERRDWHSAEADDWEPQRSVHRKDAQAHEPKVDEEDHVGRHDEEQDRKQQRPEQELSVRPSRPSSVTWSVSLAYEG